MTTEFQKVSDKELRQVSGGWWSFLLLAPFALGVAIRRAVDPDAFK